MAWWEERMELDSRKKSRMMRLKSFDMQELREIGWKEAGKSRDMQGMECKVQSLKD